MRTRRFYKYLMAMIIALGTSVNTMAQERNLKIYFSANNGTSTSPVMLLKDDHPNSNYDIPSGVTVSSEGIVWANKARYWKIFQQDVTDRLLADFVGNDKKEAHLKLTFTDFPYEVNMIQWNVMTDLFAAEFWNNLLDNLQVTTKCIPQEGSGFSSTDEKWEMNFSKNNRTFRQRDIPWQSGAVLKGLKSFEISEKCFKKSPLGILLNEQTELDERVRSFIKAGWNGQTGSNSDITDSDDSNWAFKVKFTLPDIRMRSYSCSVDKNQKVTLGQLDNTIIKGESKSHALQGYIYAHAGAVEPSYDPTDINDFHYEYFANQDSLIIGRYTGVIMNAKEAGDISVTVKLMRPEIGPDGNYVRDENDELVQRLVSFYTQTIHVYTYDPNRPEIAIGFLNGNKGYDITVGDQNAQIQGFITKNGDNITLSNSTSGYHFEYSEDSNKEIIEIDHLTGKITAKKEGDVVISAVLKNGGTIRSNTYTYLLHVFAKHEGLEWQRDNIYTYTAGHNFSTNELTFDYGSWKPKNINTSPRQWQASDYLNTKTTILENNHQQSSGSSTDSWKQIAWFKTGEFNYWRTVCQKIKMDVHVPKYSKATATYRFAANVTIGKDNGGCKYGFEVKDLGFVTSDDAHTIIRNITWNTTSSSETLSSSSGNYTTNTIVRNGADNYTEFVGAGSNPNWETNNSTSGTHKSETRYLAVMAYLWYNHSYPGDFSVGYKGIPTYTYYSTITYYTNDGTGDNGKGNVWETKDFPSTSKTAAMPMYTGAHNLPTRAGYELLGWSTDPNATTAEYQKEGDTFCPYDAVNGGGKGPVDLYAVWRPNTYTVELRHTDGGSIDGYVYATSGQAMPSVDVEGNTIKAPNHTGYDFKGYYAEALGKGTKYYNEDMSSNHVWDRTDKNYVIAKWEAHKTIIHFNFNGGTYWTNDVTVTATYGKDMPTTNVPVPYNNNGYTFAGYYYPGNETTYYNYSDGAISSARTWNIDERTLDPQVTEITLYAKWIPNTYTVTLDPQGGTGGSTSVTASYGQPLPSGLTAPTKEGYEFKGYYSNANQEYKEAIGEDYGGTQYYDKDMISVESWNSAGGGIIYAHWAPKTFVVSFDGTNGAIVPNQMQYDSNKAISDVIYNSDGVLKISFKFGGQCPNKITNGKFKKAAFKLLGFYDSNDVLVASVEVDHPEDRDIYFNENSGYWTRKDGNFVWNCAHDVDLTARYVPKYTVRDGDIIDFGTEYLEVGIDWENSMVHDLLGAAEAEKEAGRISSTNPVMVFDISNANYLDGSSKKSDDLMVPLRDKDFISPNLLVYLGKGAYNVIENEIETDGTCPGLVVTDRFSIKIPYAFTASKASYARDAKVADDEKGKDQAKNSYWGTLCLPYPIKNNASGVKFYWLESTANNYMEFEEFGDNAIIPANTPVLYCRTDGGVGSMITIEEQSVGVPKNDTYTPVMIKYSNPQPGTYPLESASLTLQDWEFRGNLKTNVFCGKGYINPPAEAIANSDITDNGEVYYFKQNKFTRLTPLMTKNGTVYQAGKMILYPYRAYFYQKGSSGSPAKVASYSILVVGEDGSTTDITNAIFGEGEGDGKIYDLNGIRVMQPVKGRLYIVDGQKKVYR